MIEDMTRVSDILHVKVGDIDSARVLIRVERQACRSPDRFVGGPVQRAGCHPGCASPLHATPSHGGL